MPFEDLPDLFTQNTQRLAATHGWMTPLASFAIAQSASSPDDAEQQANGLRNAKVENSPDPTGGFFDDGRLYDKPTGKMQLARFLRGKSGPAPIAAQNVRDTQIMLNKKGYGNLPVTGVWGSEWQGALYEYTQAESEKAMASGGGKGVSVNKVMHWLSATLPAAVGDAALGFVKGLPNDIRVLAADFIGAAYQIGEGLTYGTYEQIAEGKSSDYIRNTSRQREYAINAGIQNALGGDTTAKKVAGNLGINLDQVNKNLEVGDNTDWSQAAAQIAGDAGTAMLLAGAVGKVAGFGEAVTANLARGTAEEAAVRTPGVIGRKLFGLRTYGPKMTLIEEEALPGAISGTFDSAGAKATQAFKNFANLSDEIPVMRGNYGWHLGPNWGRFETIDPLGRAGKIWYGARTYAAAPQIFPSVRIAGDALHLVTGIGIRARAVAAISGLGSGTNSLAESVQGEHTVRDWNEQNVKNYGQLANIDWLTLFFHPEKGAGLGSEVAAKVAGANAKVTDSFRAMDGPQLFDRFSAIVHAQSKTFKDLGEALGSEYDAQRVVTKKLTDYVLGPIAKSMVDESTYAEDAVILLQKAADKAKTVGPTSVDDLTEASYNSVLKQVERDAHFKMQNRLIDDPELFSQASLSALSDYNNDGFVRWWAQDHSLLYADRKASGALAWSEHVTDMKSYIAASDVFNGELLPILKANIAGMQREVGGLNAAAVDASYNIPDLQATLASAKDSFNTAKRVERTALYGEKAVANKALNAAGRAVSDAEKAVVKAHEETQVLADKTRIGDAQGRLSASERRALAADKTSETAQKGVDTAKKAFVRGGPTVDRAAELGMTPTDLVAMEDKAIARAKQAAADAGTAWTAKDGEAVRKLLYEDLAQHSTSVKASGAEADQAIVDVADRWKELHAQVAKEGATYEPGAHYTKRFPMESRPTLPHPDPRGAIDPTLAPAQAAAQQEAGLAGRRAVENWDPYTHRLYGGHGRPLAPDVAAGEQAVSDAHAALGEGKVAAKSVDEDLNRIGIQTRGRDVEGAGRNMGVQGKDTLTQEGAAGPIGEYEARANELKDRAKAVQAGQGADGTHVSPDHPNQGFEWDFLSDAEKAAKVKEFEAFSSINFGKMSDTQWAALQAENPQRWVNRPTAIGVTTTEWDRLSDVERKIITASAGTQPPAVVDTAQNIAKAQNDLIDDMSEFGFKHFAKGAEDLKAYAGAKGIDALLANFKQTANRLAGDVTLADHADPALKDVATKLEALGYKLVIGKNLAVRTIPQTPSDVINFTQNNWAKRMVTKLGLSTELVLNSTISSAQQSKRAKLYGELATKLGRPYVDGQSIEALMRAIQANDTTLLQGTRGIAANPIGQKIAEGTQGIFWGKRESERFVTALGADQDVLSEVISSVTQLRDLRRKKVVSILTNQTAIDNFFGKLPNPSGARNIENVDVGLSKVRALTEAEANAVYIATVKSYSVPFRFAGLSNLDNLFRASAGWVGGSHWISTAGGATVLGGIGGLAVGTAQGDDPKTLLKDVGVGAAIGLGVGGPLSAVSSRYAETLGWSMANMPNNFKIAANRFRFELSPSFSLRRVVKTNLKLVLEDITPALSPLKAIESDAINAAKQSDWWKLHIKNGTTGTPEAISGLKDTGEQALRDSLATVKRVFPELNNPWADNADDADRLLRQNDVLGLYNGRAHEMHAAYELDKRGLSDEVIREKLIHIFTYGRGEQIGRSALERSANFIFFPFSFDKTLYRNVGLYLLDRPTQMLMMRQTMGAYNDFSEHHPNTPGASEWIKKHLPLLKEVQRMNAFQHGLSLGELGGINAPLLQLFLPQQWRSTSENVDVLHRYIPVLKDFERIKVNAQDQMYVAKTTLENLRRNEYKEPNFFSNPAKSTIAPSEQLHDAFAYQTKLYGRYGEAITANQKTRDPNRKHTFSEDVRIMGGYAGQPITSAVIKQMVQDRYPAFDSILGSLKQVKSNKEVGLYWTKLRAEKETVAAATFKEFTTSADRFSNIIRDMTPENLVEYQAWGAKVTADLRSKAIWLAKRDPRFYDLYKTTFQRILGPLEKMD